MEPKSAEPEGRLPLRMSKPTNHLYIHRDRSITGDFVIDPALHIPVALLPQLETKRNLSLKTTGSVTADIWLEGDMQACSPQPTDGQHADTVASLEVHCQDNCNIAVVRSRVIFTHYWSDRRCID
jgi:hypothetical protein